METNPAKKRRSRVSKWDVASESPDNVPKTPVEEPSYKTETKEQPEELSLDSTIYVSNFPTGATETELLQFFNGALLAISGKDLSSVTVSDMPAIAIHGANYVQRFFFLILRSSTDAEKCRTLNGIKFGGYPLDVHLLSDPEVPEEIKERAATVVTEVLESTHRSMHANEAAYGDLRFTVTDIPPLCSELHVRTLLEGFGELRTLKMKLDHSTGHCKGVAVVEFLDADVSEVAIQSLEGHILCGKKLGIQRGVHFDAPVTNSLPQNSVLTGGSAVSSMSNSMTQTIFSNPLIGSQVRLCRKQGDVNSSVVQLLNAVVPEDLIDDEEYISILEDMRVEASKYGHLADVIIPRPKDKIGYVAGVGKIFLRYQDITAARRARQELNGRKFLYKRVVCAAFYPLELYLQGIYTLLNVPTSFIIGDTPKDCSANEFDGINSEKRD